MNETTANKTTANNNTGNETAALARFCLRKDRRYAMLMLLCMVMGVVSVFVTKAVLGVEPDSISFNLIPLFLLLTFGPGLMAGMLLFDYGMTTSVTAGASSCNPWVLRMPILAHKIALVPVVLRTVWVFGLWLVLITTICVSLNLKFDIQVAGYSVAAGIALAASVVWILGLGWRPFSNGWWRLATFGLVGLCAYCAVAVLTSGFDRPRVGSLHALLKPFLLPSAFVMSISAYLAGVRFSVGAIKLAKLQRHGIVAESPSRFARDATSVRREHSSPRRAQTWFLMSRARPWVIRSSIFLVPGLLFVALFIPLHIVSIIMVVLCTFYAGAIALSQSEGNHGFKNRFKTNLTPCLVHAPLSTPAIAWTRMGTQAALLSAFIGTSLLVYIGWAMWPGNREVWWQWATDRAIALSVPDQAFSIGARYTIAILVGVNTWLVFRWVSLQWVGYTGRESWVVAITVAMGLGVIIVVGILVRWFISHATSWENVAASAYYWLQFLPHLVSVLLVIKVISGIASVTALIKFDLVAEQTIVRILTLWALVAGGLGIAFWLLIPDPRATILWCLAATILWTPLASIVIAPVTLKINRVR